ncbi:MAG: ABC transporter permease subunit, partial [Rhizobiales bacterium]|nr:ABC transporter permease subunit [Hyphomicrobiales bacterium]
IVLRTGSIVVLLLLWWIASRLMHDPDVLPGPLVIGDTIAHNLATPGPEGKSAFFHIGITLARIFVAFTASMLLGIAIGLAMGLSRLLERSLLVVIPLMLTMPTILMVFVAVMWFGFSEAGGLVAVMAVVTPYVAVNILEGTKAIDNSLVEMGVTFKANRSLLIRKVYLPQLMPYIFSAFRYAFGVTWKVVALAETFGLKYGIGYMFFFWFGQFNMSQVLAWIVTFVILMLVLEHGVFARLESRAFAWRASIAR